MKTDVLKDSQIKINQLGVDNSTARLVPVNSVIMVIRSGILKHTLPVAVNKVPITVNQDLKVFIPGERILTRFLAVQFKMQEKDILSGVRAVTADNIEFNSLKQRRMIVPPIDLQQKYLMFLERIDKSKFEVQKSLEKTQLLFDSLSNRRLGSFSFRGSLRSKIYVDKSELIAKINEVLYTEQKYYFRIL